VYASSAAVYGDTGDFREGGEGERPLNVYGWSKLLFDRWLRQRWGSVTAPVVGLRYFNVYGPREAHKGRMASVVHHFSRQVAETRTVRLFAGSHGYADGEHRRDFVFVDDVADLPLETLGPRFERHPFFPRRVNAEFVRVDDRRHLTMRVWERGAGETMACGTGACAVAVAAARTGRSERHVTVALPGGPLEIDWRSDDRVLMTGDAVAVFGALSPQSRSTSRSDATTRPGSSASAARRAR